MIDILKQRDTYGIINWLRNNKHIYFICSDCGDKIVMDKGEVNLDKYSNIGCGDTLINSETVGLTYENSIIDIYKDQINNFIERLYYKNIQNF